MTGYKNCDCRDCFEIVIDDSYCEECVGASCQDYQKHEGMNHECQREDAYSYE